MKRLLQFALLPTLALAAGAQVSPATHGSRHADGTFEALPGPLEMGGGLAADASWMDGVAVENIDDTLWASGPAYRAALEPGRVLYHPALGTVAPTLQHLELQLTSITLGGEQLSTTAAGEAVIDGALVRFDRGSVVERYESRLDGLEQTFVFNEPLPASGDLVVRSRVSTSLPLPAAGRSDDGLTFVHPIYGGVSIGGVTGISADGKTVAGELRFDGAFVEYVLPASFLATATYPLVLDPLIGTIAILDDSSASDRITPDVAYNSAQGRYLAVWSVIYALGDVDVRGREITGDGAPYTAGVTTFRLTINLVSSSPSVGFARGSSGFIVAWSEGSLLGQKDIWARAYYTTLGLQPEGLIATGTSNQINPDVGGENINDPIANKALVVWEDTSNGIWAALVQPLAGFPPSVTSTTHVLVGADIERPTITQCGGGPGRWLIAAQEFYAMPAPGDFDLTWVVVDWTLNIASGPSWLGDIGVNEQNAAADGDGEEFVLTWQTDVNGDWDVRYRNIVWAGAVGLERELLSGNTIDQTNPAISFTGSKYVVSFEYETSVGSNVALAEVCADTLQVCRTANPFQPTLVNRRFVAMASKWSGTIADDTNEGFIAWQEGTGGASILGHPYDGLQGGSVVNFGGRCGDTIELTTSGPAAIGNQAFGFDLTVPSGSAFAIMNARLNATPPYLCGPCEIQAVLGIVLSTSVSGTTAHFDTPIPGDPLLDGRSVMTQCFVFPTSQSPCSLFSNVSASDRIQVHLTN